MFQQLTHQGPTTADKDQPQQPALQRRTDGLAIADTGAALGSSIVQLAQLDAALVQFREAVATRGPSAVHDTAQHGLDGGAGQLPYLDRIQAAFGRHDVSTVPAYRGAAANAASAALGARAYATDGSVVLGAGGTDLHTVAHEAAHVVQQRGGVQLAGGVGAAGDRYEQHADAVADRVVAGRSAEDLLDAFAGHGPGTGTVQRKVGATKSVDRDEDGNMSTTLKINVPAFPALYMGLFPAPTPPLPGAAPPGLYAKISGGLTLGQTIGENAEKGGAYVGYSIGSSLDFAVLLGAEFDGFGLSVGGGVSLGTTGSIKYFPSTGALDIGAVCSGKVKLTATAGPLQLSKTLDKYELVKLAGSLGTKDSVSLDGVTFEVGKDAGRLAQDVVELTAILSNPAGMASALIAAGWDYANDALEQYIDGTLIQPMGAAVDALETTAEVTDTILGGIGEGLAHAVLSECAYEIGFYDRVRRGKLFASILLTGDGPTALSKLNVAALRHIRSKWHLVTGGKPQLVLEVIDVPLVDLIGSDAQTVPMTLALMENEPDIDIGQMTYREFLLKGKASGWFTLTEDFDAVGRAFEAEVLASLGGG